MNSSLFAEWTSLIEQELEKLVPEGHSAHNILYSAARYSLLSGGKRIRPLLTLATAHLFNVEISKALAPACALEMIHTYSLIHDDLPCMDDDDFRRGKPSLHKAFSEAHAVLAGDFLLTYSFEVLATSLSLSPHQKIDLIQVIARAAGGEGMIGGQVLDIAEARSVSLQELHQKKTGALFTAAVQCGGIVANVSSEQFAILTRFGKHLGYLFQVVDDILDKEHGFSIQDAEETFGIALEELKQLPGDLSYLQALIGKIIDQIRPALNR